MRLPVRFAKRADRQADEIYRYIAAQNSHEVAAHFIDDLLKRCFALSEAPMTGRKRTEIAEKVRAIGFRHAVTIYFTVLPDHVRIVKIAYRGRRIKL